ncbi:MAG: hydroxyacid dehydrogenase [Oscillospiraceae bacterium]|nr:hydroxyacid dehydrogenase [Oscillospiraceae bacterium]
MKIALINNSPYNFNLVINRKIIEKLTRYGECSPVVHQDELEKHKDFLQECSVIFSTWGMPKLNALELETYFPNVKACFYAAGSVQEFARPLLERGIKVFCAAAANAVPVAEFTFAQIILAAKGVFRAQKYCRRGYCKSGINFRDVLGNYKIKVGILGVGAIGSLVAEKLKTIDAEVFAYDPFLSEDIAEKFGVQLVSLKEVFARCDIISNHLANKKELAGILDGSLFATMKKRAVFINTGRGAQVNEKDLARALREEKGRVALLDVLCKEYHTFLSPLWWCSNAYFTPHIAGSLGGECQRMADYMIEELVRFLRGEPLVHEVTMAMLERMA